jgi:hypothetical protein
MFAAPAELLKVREGTLAETPLPLLLHAILCEQRTCTLELKAKGIEKHILIEEGSPVACRSNLLHETLGRFLVERGKLTEDQYSVVFAEVMRTGGHMGELLVAKGMLSASDLYKQLQANLARKILDCFRWPDARYRLFEGADSQETAVKMNALQLLITGITSFLPFDVVASHLVFSDEQAFALVHNPPHPVSELRLSARDTKLLHALKQRPPFAQILQRTGLDTEEGFRKLYWLCVLGLVDFSEAVPLNPPVPTSASEPAPTPAPVKETAVKETAGASDGTPPDEPAAFKDALAQAYLDHRVKDPFDLLSVPEDVNAAALRKAFLSAADRVSPMRCVTAESREKAEAVLCAYARAFAALSDADQAEMWRKRRQNGRESKAAPLRSAAAAQFRISTTLLDARWQFGEAKQRLEAGNIRGALEYFQYACDIEPKGIYKAHLAWARYLVNPVVHVRLALTELADVIKTEPDCEFAHFFSGEIYKSQKSWSMAEESYRRAAKINPQNRKYTELIQETMKAGKR